MFEFFPNLTVKLGTTGFVMDRKKLGRPSVFINIVIAEVLQETQILARENKCGTSSADKIARRLGLSNATV